MKPIVKTVLTAAALTLGLTLGLSSAASAYQNGPYQSVAYQNVPDVYVVMFRADWCAPCKIVEPRLSQALQNLQDPRIEYVNIDISGGQGDYNAHAVFDRGIVKQYNMWMGVTGFAAVIDGDTKQTLGCVNMTYEAEDMAHHIATLKLLRGRLLGTHPSYRECLDRKYQRQPRSDRRAAYGKHHHRPPLPYRP